MFLALVYPFGMLFAPDNGAGSGGNASDSGHAAAGQDGGDDKGSNANSNEGDGGNQDGNGTAGNDGGSGNAGNAGNAGGNQNSNDQNDGAVSMPRQSFNERLEKERRAGQRELLSAMGFEDVDTPEALEQAQKELGELLKFAREQRLAQMSAEERMQEQLSTVERRAKTAEQRVSQIEQERDQAKAMLRTFVIRSMIIGEAASAEYPEDVFTWAMQHKAEQVNSILDPEQPLFRDDGTLNQEALKTEVVKEIVAECKKARPKYFRPDHPGSPSNGHAQPPRHDAQADQKRTAARGLIRL